VALAADAAVARGASAGAAEAVAVGKPSSQPTPEMTIRGQTVSGSVFKVEPCELTNL